MSDLHLTLGKSASGPVKIDLETLLKTRLLVTASSGGGKSETLRRILEEAVDHVQCIVIDPEGEFSTLREKKPFVLVGEGGETPADIRTAALVATRLLELNASAVCDIYEMRVQDRHEWVRRFLDSLVHAPKSLWHPLIVVIDEAHTYCPESGYGKSVASQSVIDLCNLGRKRGFCPILATQRLSKLDKNAVEPLQNYLVGRTTFDDQTRAASTFKIDPGKATREFALELERLRDGEFIERGRAFNGDMLKVQVERAETRPPATGSAMVNKVTPTPAAIKALLPKLSDLPQEAEKKAKTEEDLRADLRTAQQRIRDLESNKSTVDEETVAMLKEKLDELSREIGTIETRIEGFKARMAKAREIATTLMEALSEEEADKLATDYLKPIEQEIRRTMPASRPAKERTQRPPAAPIPNEGISGPEQRILNALAWMDAIGVDEPEQPAVAFLANYTYGSGGYNNPRGRLNQMGLVRYISGDKMALTAEGKKLAQYPDIDPTNDALHQAILGKLPGPEGRILTVLLKHYPRAIDSNKLAELSGYTPGSGGFNNPRGRLKTLGLVEYPQPGFVIAKSLLFPEG